MRYLCLVFNEEKKLDALPENERRAFEGAHLDYDEEIKKSGHFIVAEALEPVRPATSVRVRNGKLSVTDGPYAETKEQFGGFFLMEARDLNDAIRVTSKIPSARTSSIAADTTATGGLTALAMKKLRATSGAKNIPKQFPSKET
jgi:hypothetical protein